MSNVVKVVRQALKNHENLDKGKWVIAYSGGVDSRVMLEVLASIKPHGKELIAVHVNHGLYEKAEDWENKAIEVATKHNVPMFIERLNMQHSSAIEENARDLRYEALNKYVEEGDFVFTGHHKNDNTETILFRLFRGTGLNGLSGIPETRPFGKGNLLRPILNLSRKDIELFAKENDLTHVEDPSNKDSKYTRNFIRNEVLPLLETRWNRVVENVNALAKKANEAESLLQEIAKEDLENMQDINKNYSTAPCINMEKLLSLSSSRAKNALFYFVNEHAGEVKSSKYFDNLLKVVFSENKNNSNLRMVDFGQATVYNNGRKIWVIDHTKYIYNEIMKDDVNWRAIKNYMSDHKKTLDVNMRLRNGKTLLENRIDYVFKKESELIEAKKINKISTIYIYRCLDTTLKNASGMPDIKKYIKKDINPSLLEGILLFFSREKKEELEEFKEKYPLHLDEKFKVLLKNYILESTNNETGVFERMCGMLKNNIVESFHFSETELATLNKRLREIVLDKPGIEKNNMFIGALIDFYKSQEKEHHNSSAHKGIAEIIIESVIKNQMLRGEIKWTRKETEDKWLIFMKNLLSESGRIMPGEDNINNLNCIVEKTPVLQEAFSVFQKRFLNDEFSGENFKESNMSPRI